MSKAFWSPQPKQQVFQSRWEDEVLFGGAAGGGKSDALLAEALRQIHIPNYRGILFRATFPQLEAMIDRSQSMFTQASKRAKYNTSEKKWTFPSGARIFFGYMQREKDKHNYQGKPYDFIGFDELTHFSFTQYMYLKSRNRPKGPNTRVYMRATANPGGIGHGWVKERFITAAPPQTTITEQVEVKGPDGKLYKENRHRIFIPSSVFDNQKLLENDPNYIFTLGALPNKERQALLYGDWDSFEGQVFEEWTDDPNGYQSRLWTHVIEPFLIPEHWKIFRGYDWGYSRPYSVGWFACDDEGRFYRIKELYGCTNTPNTGTKQTTAEVAQSIKEIENTDPNLKGKRIRGIGDPSIWDESKGESIGREFERNGIYFEKGDNARISGKMQFHYRLAFDSRGIPMFYTFNTCKHFIRCIPLLIYDEHKPEDVDTRLEDHNYDEARYVFMTRPLAVRKNHKAKKLYVGTDGISDPLNMIPKHNNTYSFLINK